MNVKEARYANTRKLIEQCGGVTVFADKIGKSQSQASQIAGENPIKGIGNKIAAEIEAAFGLERGWLDRVHLPLGIDPISIHDKGIPLIGRAKAGEWCEAIDIFAPGDAEDWLPRMPGNGPRTYALRVDGDSMTNPYPGQRSYPAGTIIYVDPDKEVLPGKAVIAKLPDTGEITFKIYTEDAGKAYLKPLNPQYPIIEIAKGIHFCGVVQGSYFPE